MKLWIVITLGVGILVFLLSLIVKSSVEIHHGWSEQRGHEFMEATMRLHSLSHQHGVGAPRQSIHRHDIGEHDEVNPELDAARQDHARLHAQLDRARRRRAWVLIIRWSGVALIGAGVGGYTLGKLAESR